MRWEVSTGTRGLPGVPGKGEGATSLEGSRIAATHSCTCQAAVAHVSGLSEEE